MANRVVVRELVTLLGYELRPDAVKRADEVVDRFREKLEALRQKAVEVGKALTVGVTLPTLGLGAFAIKAASDAEEIHSKFNTVFGDLADGARAWAEQTATATQRSKIDLEKWLATLQDTFVPLGFARDRAAEFSQQIAQLGIDVASFDNADPSETIDLMTSAIVGNHEAVRRFGIIITETSLKAELLRMGLAGNVQQATEQQKVLARLNIIMRSTADAQGDAARTAASFANRWLGLKAAVHDLAEGFGKILLPMAARVVSIVTRMVRWVDRLGRGWKVLIVWIAAAAAAMGPLLLALLAIAKVALIVRLALLAWPWVTTIAGFVKGTIAAKGLAAALGLAAKAAWGLFVRFFIWPIAVAGAIVALLALVNDLWVAMNGGESVIGELFKKFLDAPIDPEEHWINKVLRFALQQFRELIKGAEDFGKGLAELVEVWTKPFDKLIARLETLASYFNPTSYFGPFAGGRAAAPAGAAAPPVGGGVGASTSAATTVNGGPTSVTVNVTGDARGHVDAFEIAQEVERVVRRANEQTFRMAQQRGTQLR